MSDRLSIPAAILMGSALVGAGLYFGLRERDAARAPATDETRESDTIDDAPSRASRARWSYRPSPIATSAATPRDAGFTAAVDDPPVLPVVEPRTTPSPTAVPNEITSRAMAEVARHHAMLVDRCVPRHGVAPGGQSRMVLGFTFSADGQTLGRGIVEERGSTIPGAAACVSTTLPPITIPPPGVTTRVDVPLVLP